MTGFIAVNTMKSTNQQKRQSLDYINVSFAIFSSPFKSLFCGSSPACYLLCQMKEKIKFRK